MLLRRAPCRAHVLSRTCAAYALCAAAKRMMMHTAGNTDATRLYPRCDARYRPVVVRTYRDAHMLIVANAATRRRGVADFSRHSRYHRNQYTMRQQHARWLRNSRQQQFVIQHSVAAAPALPRRYTDAAARLSHDASMIRSRPAACLILRCAAVLRACTSLRAQRHVALMPAIRATSFAATSQTLTFAMPRHGLSLPCPCRFTRCAPNAPFMLERRATAQACRRY